MNGSDSESHTAAELLTDQFYNWERRGRGWDMADAPVRLEPPFRPFLGHFVASPGPAHDNGLRESILGRMVRGLLGGGTPEPPGTEEIIEENEPEPEWLEEQGELAELQVALPKEYQPSRDVFAQCLSGLGYCHSSLAFEVVGTKGGVVAQVTAAERDAEDVVTQLRAHFPEAVINRVRGYLPGCWRDGTGVWIEIREFGLHREFMLPLASSREMATDPLVGICGALERLEGGEVGVFQVLFEPVRRPWAASVMRAVTVEDGQPFFSDAPEFVPLAKQKLARPLFAAVVRAGVRGASEARTSQIMRALAGTLGLFANAAGNELVPLDNEAYPDPDHEHDLLERCTRRFGMLINSDELVSLAHLPTAAVRSRKLVRVLTRTKEAPETATGGKLVLGENVHEGRATPVTMTPEQRVRHLHVIGVSGTGKSTLLFNLIRQDIESGAGVALLDPHGDLVDRLLGVIPQTRIGDVVLLDPSDAEYSVGFNILSAHSELEKNLLASDLVSVFQRLSGSWGDQMASVLNNAILAFLESSRGGTLADLRRFLLEPRFREEFLQTVRDPDVVYYWRTGFAHLAGNKSIGPVLTRLETFLSRKPIRYMVSQARNRLDFADILDTGKVFLGKLSQGTVGRENSYLLGTLLVSKLQQLAMSRQSQAQSRRRDFWIYIDEFHNFITPSMAEILTGARKYRVGLVLAHQELRQLQRDSEVASAVLSNPGTRVCFRVGDDDARKLANGFSFFEARDLQNLGTGEAICRVERSDFDFNLTVPLPDEPPEAETVKRRDEVIAASRKRYATPRAEIEAMLYKDFQVDTKEAEPTKPPIVEAPPSAPERSEEPPPPPEAEPPAPAPPPRPRPPRPPATTGRGGPQHKYLQHLIEQLAFGMEFQVEVEKEVVDKTGSVDVALKKGDKRFAFEISVTTEVKHEFGNIRKCFKDGFDQVVMVATEPGHLAKLRTAVSKEFPPEELGRIRFCLVDEIPTQLTELAALSASKDTVSHGKKTKVKYRALSKEEAKKVRVRLAEVSTRSLKKFKRG